jgi:hypothetical protein
VSTPCYGPPSLAGASTALLAQSVPFLHMPVSLAAFATYGACLLLGLGLMLFEGRIGQFGSGVATASAAFPIGLLGSFLPLIALSLLG